VKRTNESSKKGTPPGGFLLAGSGITLSFLSIFWTWGGARLSRRVKRKNPSRVKTASMVRRLITVGSYLNIFGIIVTLIGAEQIIGLLVAKVLTMQGAFPGGGMSGVGGASLSSQTLQPIDILVVQANTNTIVSHFISLVSWLYLTRRVRELDPPTDEDVN